MSEMKELQEKLAQCQKEKKDLEYRIEELSDFVENAAIPLHWVDSDGIILWANQAELDTLGFTREEYIGFPISHFHADQEIIADMLNRLGNDETLHNYPARLKCKDGSIKHVLISSNVLRKDGKFIHSRCFTRDITPIVEEGHGKARLLNELEESEARLRMAIELTNLGTWDWNPGSGDIFCSDECKKIFQIPLDGSLTFESFSGRIHTDDRDSVLQELANATKPDSTGACELTYRINRFDDNSVRWIRVQGKVYFNEAREAIRFLGTIVDITDIKQSHEKIMHSEKLFKSIALNIPKSLIIVIDKEHRFLTIEGDYMEKLGYDSANYAGKHPLEVAPPEEYESSKHLYERVMAGEKFSVERKSATGEDYMVHFVPLKNDLGEVETGLIIALDITDIKKAEENSAQLAAIITSSNDAIISKTLNGIITSWNESAEKMFAYQAEEIIGQPILKLIPPERQEEEPQIISRLKNGERVEHFETQRLTKGGRLIDVSLTISPVKDAQGKIIGISKIARDITEKKQEEHRKNDFIAMVSHELKTPLTAITSYIQLLLSRAKKGGDEFTLHALSRAEVQARKMISMIHDFLSLARLEEGKILLNKEEFELHPLIEEISRDAEFLSSKHTIQLVDCEDLHIYADRDKIGQVLINLLSNAVKYSPSGGAITIGCEKHAGSVKVFVRDEGVGIDPMDQKRLFERFYRVNNDKLKTVAGFGIGLYLVSEILRYHNSKIEVESEENVGSTFYFTLNTLIN